MFSRRWLARRSEVAALEEKVRELTDKLHRLESREEREDGEQGKSPAGTHIHIGTMNVDRPVLESLLFRLDRLDIQELSGSLNLGNNFDTSRSDKTPAVATSSEAGKLSAGEGQSPAQKNGEASFQQTDKGFSVSM